MNQALASSADPKELSLMIKGAIVAGAPLVALIVKAAGGEISNDELETIVTTASDIVIVGGSLVSLVMMFWGFARKIYHSFK